MTTATRTATAATGWWLCHHCRLPIYNKQLARSGGVCPECGYHRRLSARERMAQLLDPGSVEHLPSPCVAEDALGFEDTKLYSRRIAEAQESTGLDEAAIAARGSVLGSDVVLVAMEFGFMGGSLSGGLGDLITRAAEVALDQRRPLVLVCASGGARMQEGVISLMQMAKTSQALLALDQAGVPTVSVITDPVYGGVAASFATLCDVIVAEPGARMGFAGPRVIERTIGESLPEGFQRAEFLLENGQIDAIAHRSQLRATLGRILRVLAPTGAGDEESRRPEGTILVTDPLQLTEEDAWETVRAARNLGRPTALDYVDLIVDGFQELHGDRLGGDCPATVGGVGLLQGRPVVVIGQQKGHTASELRERNFGMPLPAGYRKAARLMRLAAKTDTPVLTLVDTGGAYPGVDAEKYGQAAAIAENLRLMSALPVPIVAAVVSEGGSGGALGLAVADRVFALSKAVYSVISPEGCASILWRDPAQAPQAARQLGLRASDLLSRGVIDGVIPEPGDGAHSDREETARRLACALVPVLDELAERSTGRLLSERRDRFRGFGTASPAAGQESER